MYVAFDSDFAAVTGWPVKTIRMIIITLVATAIVFGHQSDGHYSGVVAIHRTSSNREHQNQEIHPLNGLFHHHQYGYQHFGIVCCILF
jgi:hypothetical protein